MVQRNILPVSLGDVCLRDLGLDLNVPKNAMAELFVVPKVLSGTQQEVMEQIATQENGLQFEGDAADYKRVLADHLLNVFDRAKAEGFPTESQIFLPTAEMTGRGWVEQGQPFVKNNIHASLKALKVTGADVPTLDLMSCSQDEGAGAACVISLDDGSIDDSGAFAGKFNAQAYGVFLKIRPHKTFLERASQPFSRMPVYC